MAGLTNGKTTPRQWTRDHEIERLSQLRADVDSSLERLWTVFLYRSTQVPLAGQDEWLRRVEQVEKLRGWALKDLETIIEEICSK